MIIIFITLLLMSTAYLSLYDYGQFLKNNSTGRLSLIIRSVLFPVFVLMVFKDTQNWFVSIGFVFFIQWWVWDMFTGMLWYRNPFATGSTKYIDKLFKAIPDQLLWFGKWFLAICFLSFYLNSL